MLCNIVIKLKFFKVIGNIISSVVVRQHFSNEKWTVKIIQPSEDLLKKLVQDNIDVSTYEIEKPDIVEMLCAATGQDIEQIGLEINELNTNNAKEEE